MTLTERMTKLQALAQANLPRLEKLRSDSATYESAYQAKLKELATFPELLDEAEIRAAYQGYNDLFREFSRIGDQLGAVRASYQASHARLELEQKALAFYSSVLDDITAEYVTRLEDALNRVYLYVFQNPNKRAHLALTDRYNKKVLMLQMVNTYGEKEYAEDLDESGFSVSVVLGTMLLVYYILYNNLERIICFDESFTGLADETAARFFYLLKNLVDEMGFKFLIVSHETRYVEYASRIYFVRSGKFMLEKAPELEEAQSAS